MSYTFRPPTLTERPDTGNRLIDTRMKMLRGVSILKAPGGAYVTVTYPTTDDITAAAIFYQGGHEYVVSDAEAASLTAAGFTGLTIIVIPAGPNTYDIAVYDVAVYG